MNTERRLETEAESTQGKGGFKNRNSNRMDKFKKNKGEQQDNAAKKAIYERLLFGYKDVTDALRGFHIGITSHSIVLPISTRGIGFIVRILIKKFSSLNIQNIEFYQFCCALYRVSLALMDARLTTVMNDVVTLNRGNNDFRDLFTTLEEMRVLGRVSTFFAPLVNLIDAVGCVKAFGTQYIPRIAVAPVIDQTVQVDPTTVHFANLREVVTALAAPATNQATRRWFYEHNPLPNARWSDRFDHPARRDAAGNAIEAAGFPLLLNADDIIPANFGLAQLRNDVELVTTCIEQIARKYPKYIHAGRLDLSSPGNHSILVSNQVENVRCGDMTWLNNLPNFNTSSITGDVTDFWSPECIGEHELYFGVVHLTGELNILPPTSYAPRLESCAKERINLSFVDAVQNLIA